MTPLNRFDYCDVTAYFRTAETGQVTKLTCRRAAGHADRFHEDQGIFFEVNYGVPAPQEPAPVITEDDINDDEEEEVTFVGTEHANAHIHHLDTRLKLNVALEKLAVVEEWLTEQLTDLEWFGREQTQFDFENGVYDGDREEADIRRSIELYNELTDLKTKLLGIDNAGSTG